MSFVALLNPYYDGLGSLKQAHFIEIGKTGEVAHPSHRVGSCGPWIQTQFG